MTYQIEAEGEFLRAGPAKWRVAALKLKVLTMASQSIASNHPQDFGERFG